MTDTTDPSTLIEVLRGGRQCDEDGSEIIMSRQACCEAADLLEALASTSTQPASAAIRSDALKEAADICNDLENNLADGAGGFGADGADCYAAIMALRAGIPLGKPSAVVQEPAVELVQVQGLDALALKLRADLPVGTWLYTHPPTPGAVEPTAPPTSEVKTGWPPGMLQDDSKGLSKWLSNTPNARQEARDAAAPPPVAGDAKHELSDREWAALPANLREGCTKHVPGVGDI